MNFVNLQTSKTSSCPNAVELNIIKSENRSLRSKLMQSQAELEIEQDIVFSLKRKLNALENERLNEISTLNEEVSQLSSETVRLRAQLEKGKAAQQNVEYELAKAKKDLVREKRAAEEREIYLQQITEDYKRKEDRLNIEKKNLAKELDASLTAAQEDTSQYISKILEKDKEIASVLKELESQTSEKSELHSTIQNKDRSIYELGAESEQLKASIKQLNEDLQKKVLEVEQHKNKMNLLEQKLCMILNKVESLESAQETEKMNHLQTKHNLELMQNDLKTEKTARNEAVVKLEQLQEYVKKLEESCKEENLRKSKLQEKLMMTEKDLEGARQQLAMDLSDKKQLMMSLTQQLEDHQKTVNQQKLEISRAKKRQMQLDEAYMHGIQELQILLSLYNKKGSKLKDKESVNGNAFCTTLSSVRDMFDDYRQKHEKLLFELANQQIQIDQLTKDCKSYKGKLTSSAKTCQVTADALDKVKSELRQMEIKCHNLEDECERFLRDSVALKNNLAKEQAYGQDLREQVMKVSVKHKNDEQTSSTFVMLLHQLLNTIDDIAMTTDKQAQTVGSNSLQKWNDLGLIVNEQVSGLIHLLNQEKEKVSHLEELLRQKERTLEQVYSVHEEELKKMARMYESTVQQWMTEKDDIQKQYMKKLAEIQSKHKISAEETWHRFESANCFQQELEEECARLRNRLSHCHQEKNTLMLTCALLCGTLYPLNTRFVELIIQRNILIKQFIQFELFKEKVKTLILAISADTFDASETSHSTRRLMMLMPKLRFRVAVIAVMAVRRLIHLASGKCQLFILYNVLPFSYGTTICSGGIEPALKMDRSEGCSGSSTSHSSNMRRESGILTWLTNSDLQIMVQSSMEDLEAAVCKLKEGVPGYDNERLVNVAKNCFQKFLSSLPSLFPYISVDSDIMCSSVSNCLKKGLENSLHTEDLNRTYTGSQRLSRALQLELLSLTQRLHATEIERRDLRAKCSIFKQKHLSSEPNDEALCQMQMQLAALKEQLEKSVSLDKFTQVCDELARALEREEKAQTVLRVQQDQIEEQTRCLDLFVKVEQHKETSYTAVEKDLPDGKMELSSKDKAVEHLTQQISELGEEKMALLNKISDAERALHTAAKDKESIIYYAKTMTNWFTNLLSADAVPDVWQVSNMLDLESSRSKPGSDLLAVRNLVAAFVETQNYLLELKAHLMDAHESDGMQAKIHQCIWKKDYNRPTVVTVGGDAVCSHLSPHARPSVVSPHLTEQVHFRPLLTDSNALTPLKGKGSCHNNQGAKLNQKKLSFRKTKSRLPRHQAIQSSSLKPVSCRYSSPTLASEARCVSRSTSS